MSHALSQALIAAGVAEAAACEAVSQIIEQVNRFAQRTREPNPTPPADAAKSLDRFASALEKARDAFAALAPDVRAALQWEVSRPPRRGLFGGTAARLPTERMHPGAESVFDALEQEFRRESKQEQERQATRPLLGERDLSRLPRIPGASFSALARATRALLSWRYKKRRGAPDSGATDMFVDCILIWHEATGAWPPLTKDIDTAEVSAPLYQALFALLHDCGAGEIRGVSGDTFRDAVHLAMRSPDNLPGLFSGREAARLALAQRRKEKRRKKSG